LRTRAKPKPSRAPLIAEASQSKPKPQLIVVATYGWTPWGEPVGIPVVACITGRMPTT
jgi:hypothetical protein